MNTEYNVLKVNIFGTDYPVRGTTDSAYIAKVAKYVDAKMREVDDTASVKPLLKVAILAALNIADELFNEREDKQKLISLYQERIKKLNESLTEVLHEGS